MCLELFGKFLGMLADDRVYIGRRRALGGCSIHRFFPYMQFVRTMLPQIAPTPFLSARATLDIAAWFYEARRHDVSTAGFALKACTECGPLTVDGRQLTDAGRNLRGKQRGAVRSDPFASNRQVRVAKRLRVWLLTGGRIQRAARLCNGACVNCVPPPEVLVAAVAEAMVGPRWTAGWLMQYPWDNR